MNNKLLGFPFDVTCVSSKNQGASPLYDAAVVEIYIHPQSTRDDCILLDPNSQELEIKDAKFTDAFVFFNDMGSPTLGLTSDPNYDTNLCDFINAAVGLCEPKRVASICAMKVTPCFSTLDVILFYNGMLYETGDGYDHDILKTLAPRHRLTENTWFSHHLGFFPRFCQYLAEAKGE